jgi:hypothetical protein
MRIRCRGGPFTEQFPNDSPGIADVFTGRYQATHVPSRDRCIATAIYTPILSLYIYCFIFVLYLTTLIFQCMYIYNAK